MLKNDNKLLQQAYKDHWAIGAFHASNLETTQAIIEAAEELQSPVIVQTSEKEIDYAGLHELASLVLSLASHARIPVLLHLDQGHSFDIAERCVAEGYTGLTRDGSSLSFEQNCKETKRVVALGHAHAISVEGVLGGRDNEDDSTDIQEVFTRPDDPRRFVELTGVDFFAPAIGIMYKNNAVARVDIDALRAVRRDIDGVPLVLRSCPKVPDRDIITSIRSGVAKVIVGSELRYVFSESLRHNLSDHASVYDPRGILGPAKDAVKAVVKEKIILFGSSGKA